MSAEADAYVMDAETFGMLRRLAGKLRGDGPLVGDERRNLASRMNALLQKARPQNAQQGRWDVRPENSTGSDSSNDRSWTSQPFGKM